MTFDEIERLVRRLDGTDITAVTLGDAGGTLTLRLAPVAVERPGASAPASGTTTLRSPGIGHLRLRHPEAAPTTALGFPRIVKHGEIIAFLEAGAGLQAVVAERDGTIGAPLVAEGSLVGYGTPLFPMR